MTSNPNNGGSPQSLKDLVSNFKYNFLSKQVEIVPGLTVNQYDIVKRVYFYIHNQFESGPNDENGDPKYFYDLVTDRNDQATKNIEFDTKDVYIKSETKGGQLKSWLLRREFVGYAKTSGFGMKLNELADDLPDFGTVVWKKIKNEEGRTDVAQVELINLMNDPQAKNLKDGLVIERHLLTQYDIYAKKSWDSHEVEELINSGQTVSRVGFMETSDANLSQTSNRVDTTTPYYELYEMWGEIPRALYEKHKTGGLPRKESELPDVTKGEESKTVTNNNETVYVMAIVGGVQTGKEGCVLFCKEVDRSLFPYKEVHYRRKKGRWLGFGNFEICFPLIEKANELTNRFFASLRIALLHLYQTRDQLHVKNVLTDLLDGDVIVSKSELTVIPTEIRGAVQYQTEMAAIEKKADRLCNSFEIVTGENMPSGTPFKLGAQQLKSATKLFDYIKQNMGLFVESVFNEWLLPDFAKSLTEEHVLELLDDAEDIQTYYNVKRKMFQYDVLKRYILEHSEYPDPAQLSLVGELVKDQFARGPKEIEVEKNYYEDQKYSLKVVITGENDNKKENLETIANLTQVALANPAGLQDPRLMKLVNIVLESSGYSPLEINFINETPTNSTLNPAFQGGGGADRSIPLGSGGGVPSAGGNAPQAAAVAAAAGGGQPVSR